jgi:Raf kinase inhibitor-like YbhB/YbcL family protein
MRKVFIIFLLITGCIILLCACVTSNQEVPTPTTTPLQTAAIQPIDTQADPTYTPEPTITPTPMSFSLSSPAFNAGEMIPVRYSRKGDDLSPPLEWGEPPAGTESFALILYSDPLMDGGGNWVQWILYNIPPDTRSLPEGIQPDEEGRLVDGSLHFKNSWGELDYGGPNPQHVQTFKYYFVLYALDSDLDLVAVEQHMEQEGTLPWIGSSKAVLEEAVRGQVLGLGELVAKYKEELNE